MRRLGELEAMGKLIIGKPSHIEAEKTLERLVPLYPVSPVSTQGENEYQYKWREDLWAGCIEQIKVVLTQAQIESIRIYERKNYAVKAIIQKGLSEVQTSISDPATDGQSSDDQRREHRRKTDLQQDDANKLDGLIALASIATAENETDAANLPRRPIREESESCK
mmetsp:Transcript_31507/g.76883  ORF Transcript_31507/g.76883 Transcript_31507/m.76883 type:complete len:166 (+) Transcript_31507:732-1229(+)